MSSTKGMHTIHFSSFSSMHDQSIYRVTMIIFSSLFVSLPFKRNSLTKIEHTEQ